MSRNRRLKLQIFRLAVFVLLGAFFLIPIGAMFEFSTRGVTEDAPRTLNAWLTIAQTTDLVAAILASLRLAVLTSLGILVLIVLCYVLERFVMLSLTSFIELFCL